MYYCTASLYHTIQHVLLHCQSVPYYTACNTALPVSTILYRMYYCTASLYHTIQDVTLHCQSVPYYTGCNTALPVCNGGLMNAKDFLVSVFDLTEDFRILLTKKKKPSCSSLCGAIYSLTTLIELVGLTLKDMTSLATFPSLGARL